MTKVKNTAFNVEGFQFKFPSRSIIKQNVSKNSHGGPVIFSRGPFGYTSTFTLPTHLTFTRNVLLFSVFLNASVPEPHRLEYQLRLTLVTVIIENCSISLRLTFTFSKNVTTFFAVLKKKKTSSFNDTLNSTPVGTLALNPWD